MTTTPSPSSPRAWPRWAAAGLLCALLSPAFANPRSVSFTDASGDPGPVGDVVGAQLNFDSVTGNWTIHWTADAAHPFTGNVRFDLNLFDTTLAPFSNASNPQVTLDGFVNFGAASATEFSYSGSTAFLANWHIGDLVSTGNGTQFQSGAVQLDAPFGRDIMLTTGTVTGRDNTVPEPGTLALLLGAMGWLGVATRKRWSGAGKPTVW